MLAPETIDKANATIRQIKRTFHRDVMIEVYANVPKELEADFQRNGKEQFFADWVISRARALQANGLFILIVKNPGRLQVEVGQETQKKDLTLADAAELRQVMVKSFQRSQFDRGLLDGLDFIVRRLERNTGVPAGMPPPGPNGRRQEGRPPRRPEARPEVRPEAGGASTAGPSASGTGRAPAPSTAPTTAPSPAATGPETAPASPAAAAPGSAPATGPAPAPTRTETDF
jgi:hypothetical protein